MSARLEEWGICKLADRDLQTVQSKVHVGLQQEVVYVED
jgi:hypothetical protein